MKLLEQNKPYSSTFVDLRKDCKMYMDVGLEQLQVHTIGEHWGHC